MKINYNQLYTNNLTNLFAALAALCFSFFFHSCQKDKPAPAVTITPSSVTSWYYDILEFRVSAISRSMIKTIEIVPEYDKENQSVTVSNYTHYSINYYYKLTIGANVNDGNIFLVNVRVTNEDGVSGSTFAIINMVKRFPPVINLSPQSVNALKSDTVNFTININAPSLLKKVTITPDLDSVGQSRTITYFPDSTFENYIYQYFVNDTVIAGEDIIISVFAEDIYHLTDNKNATIIVIQ
ncbi:MAG: hypothetical protein HY738_17285 [Bacteroidia bacterium]|nr:hypothetical protein [Bacteroidia bacterium]